MRLLLPDPAAIRPRVGRSRVTGFLGITRDATFEDIDRRIITAAVTERCQTPFRAERCQTPFRDNWMRTMRWSVRSASRSGRR